MLTRAWSIFLFCFYAGGAFRLPMLVCLLLYLQNGEADNDSTCHRWPSTVGGTRWWSGSEGCWFLQAASKTIVQKLVKRAARSIEDVNRDWTIPFPVSLIIFLIRNIFCTVVPHLERVFLRILITVLCSRKKGTCKSRLPNHIASNILNPCVYLRFNICLQVPLTCKSLCTLCAYYHLSPFRHWSVDDTKEIISLMMHIKLIFFCN